MTALADKVVLVTGVARGCGKVLAQAFAADRAKVVGCDTDVDGGRATAAAARAAGGEMTFIEAGVNALTKAAAVEVAKDNISVNALAFAAIDIPGDMIWRFLDSQGIAPEQLIPMFPVGRMGRPGELVAAVRYLCSDDARYMTGTMLVLDGGYTAQ